ncbi:hypothetical protein METBIDRAFT_195843 [Metschnikowia bicuspidata var. bicuspidata NRRL YB-4993]|uniref:Uncharacterized protein n=1 Tax=Metschnikowia bicuspidata var. bicuspidata NRRL YB-4993 TaxID=869754 RepID=A0A1A0H8T6_9ASCO|nr:hypothetical protein METBIDRAFT_195843 [Metschnikowia bicuspidata var. bicuspidata NRRL YB-4993]OBA20298.1 hypothetical protein METBIDRAFT_195843 [Metschnikowia bicuspidata var. bicuspidata NRRL YB-4993]
MIAQVIFCFRLINCVSEIAGLCLTGYFLVGLLLELSVQAESTTMDLNVVQIKEYYSGPFGAEPEIQNHSGNIYADFIPVHIVAASAAPHPKYSKTTETDCSFVSSPSSDGSILELSDGDTGASSVLSFNSDSKLGSSAGSSMKPAVVVDYIETDEIKRTRGILIPDNNSIFNGESKISKVETTALLPAANPDIDMESGWQVQGRKRQNCHRRTGTKVETVSRTSGKKLASGPESPVSQSSLSKNPFLVLADIDENDYQEPRPSRPHKKVPGNLELSSLENVSPGISAAMDLAVDNYEALTKNSVTNSMDIACETIDEKALGLSQDLLEGSPPDAEEDPHMGSKKSRNYC